MMILSTRRQPSPQLLFRLAWSRAYVDVKMKWKKDPTFDAVPILNHSTDLRPLLALKNIIAADSQNSIPVSLVSKRARALEISGRVAAFLRRYPAFFHEFTGPLHNLPWFRLTPQALHLHRQENAVYEAHREEIISRLRRLVLMSRENRLPLRIVQGMLWFLGLPEDFMQNPEEASGGSLRVVEMGDGEKGLHAEVARDEMPLSALQRHSIKQLGGVPPNCIAFPLFPSKGLRLKKKIDEWLEGFQRLPYMSPYEDSSSLDPCSDVSEKRAVGALHELLSLFVDNSAERRRLLCLRKHLALPQKFGQVFERHPHVFYLLLKNKTCTVVLKEAYRAGSDTGIERHPMLEVRNKYVKLMKKSEDILRERRKNGESASVNDEEKFTLKSPQNRKTLPDTDKDEIESINDIECPLGYFSDMYDMAEYIKNEEMQRKWFSSHDTQ